MEPDEGELSRVSSHSNPTTKSEEETKIQLHLRLLDTTPKRLPRWMVHYRLASYIIYSIIACYSLIYLIFIGVQQANPRFQIQYSAIVRYLEYNSYSILSPLLCPVLMLILMYHVKHKVKLEEGDFFGVLSILLFLALLNFHDGWGILKILHWNRDHDLKSKGHIDPPPKDDTSRNDLHWQYAWSTRTACAKRYVRDLKYKYEYSKKHVVRQIVFQNSNPVQKVARQGGLLQARVLPCNGYHDNRSRAKIRAWMREVQNEFKCCGPYGYEEWKDWFANDGRTGCKPEWKKNGDIPSCFDPVMRWLDNIMLATCWIMVFQGIFYLICIVLAVCHHSAMKLEGEKIEKKHSLLSMTDHFADPEPHWWTVSRPADHHVIVGEYPSMPKNDDMENGDTQPIVSTNNTQQGGNHKGSIRSREDSSEKGGKKGKKAK